MTFISPTQLHRAGNITSSGISAIMSNGKAAGTPGKPFFTYIEECNYERRLGKRVDAEIVSKYTSWGILCERYVMSHAELLGMEYEQRPDEPIFHPEIDYWCGCPDANKAPDTVADLKCPFTLKSFCQLVEPIYKGLQGKDAVDYLINNTKDGEGYYYQIVSNAILTNCNYGELIVFCPYEEELEAIKDLANQAEGKEIGKFYSIAMAELDALPSIKKDGYYKNINTIRFEIPKEDKEKMIARVASAGLYLEKQFNPNASNKNQER